MGNLINQPTWCLSGAQPSCIVHENPRRLAWWSATKREAMPRRPSGRELVSVYFKFTCAGHVYLAMLLGAVLRALLPLEAGSSEVKVGHQVEAMGGLRRVLGGGNRYAVMNPQRTYQGLVVGLLHSLVCLLSPHPQIQGRGFLPYFGLQAALACKWGACPCSQ